MPFASALHSVLDDVDFYGAGGFVEGGVEGGGDLF